LTFPILPWIRAEYNILDTDFKRFSIVSAGPDFIQVYSRKPCLNPKERMTLKEMVKNFGYDPNDLKDTPTECDTDPVDMMIQDSVDVLNI
jgi:lipocalin